MARVPRFSASFILAAIVLALLLLLSTSAAVSSDKDEKQAAYLAERDLLRNSPAKKPTKSPSRQIIKPTPPKTRLKPGGYSDLTKKGMKATRAPTIAPKQSAGIGFASIAQEKLAAIANQVASAQAPFKFCTVLRTYATVLPCQVLFPNPTNNAFITPVVLPFANPANNFQQCWGAKPASWQCGQPNALGGAYGTYPNAYVGSYIEFPSGYLNALQADTKSTAARDSIIAVMEEFVYNVVANMLGLGTSMNARCGYPNNMVFGCTSTTGRKNNPQLNFGVAPDGRVRLLIIFVVDWNVITSKGSIKTFAQYENTVRSFFSSPAVSKLWDAAVSSKGPGSSKFLGGGLRRALEEEEQEQEEGSLRKLPAAKGKPKVTGSGVVKVAIVGGSK